jgi:hypothetical protein
VKALIAGPRIRGLAADIALRRAGMDVEVVERSRELREVGAGLMIWPNGTRSLQSLGVEITALTVRRISFCNWRGRQLMEAPVDLSSGRYCGEVPTARPAVEDAGYDSGGTACKLKLASAPPAQHNVCKVAGGCSG